MEGSGVPGRKGQRGKKWDNYNSVINKIHFKKKEVQIGSHKIVTEMQSIV